MKSFKKNLAIFVALVMLFSVVGFDVLAEEVDVTEGTSTGETLPPDTGETLPPDTGETEPTEPEPTEPEPTEPQPTEPGPTEPAPPAPPPDEGSGTDPLLLTPPLAVPPPEEGDDPPVIEDEILMASASFSATFRMMGTADVGVLQQDPGDPIVLIEVLKNWVDVPEGDTPTATFELYADGEKVVGADRTLTYPATIFFWTGLPYYQADGVTKINYTVVELPIPGYGTSVERIESTIDSATRITPNNHTTWPQTPYLSYFVTMLTEGDGFLVWTLSHMPEDLRQQFINEVLAKTHNLGPFANMTLANTYWFEGPQAYYNTEDKGYIQIDYQIVNNQVVSRDISFEEPQTWTQFIIGTHSNLKYIFTNTKVDYGEIPVTFAGSKILTGRALAAGEFNFRLYESDEEGYVADYDLYLAETTNMANGTFSFSKTFDDVEPGDVLYFVITEEAGTLPGVTYDTREYLATLTFTLVNEVLQANITYQRILGEGEFATPSALEFYNEYTALPGTATIAGRKVLEGRDLEDGEFEFELYASDAEGVVPDDAMPLQTTTNDGQSWSFTLTFEQGEEGDYWYVVKEVVGDLDGVDYDTNALLFMVEVYDDLEGQMMADVTNPTDPVFYNEYMPAPVMTSIQGLKALTGRELLDDEFEFELFMADSEGKVAADADPLQTTHNKAVNWKFDLTFDEVGTYYYVVREIPEVDAEDDDMGTMIFDDAEFFFEVEVWDDLEGALLAQVTSPIDREFNNRYLLPMIEVVKMVEEDDFSEVGDKLHYTFSVKNIGNVPLVKLTVNDAKLGITDMVIELDEPLEVGETYTFELEPYDVTAADVAAEAPIKNTITVVAETEEGIKAEDSDDVVVPFTKIMPLPPTGESRSYWLAIAAIAVGLVAITGLFVRRRLRQSK
ncbi:MAG: FctA domain-containing protein [Eubacteriales bacterium]|nr:FctA domain-containing protein [Eubacteriales bacterium]